MRPYGNVRQVRGYWTNRPSDVAASSRILAQDCTAKLQALYQLIRDNKAVRRTITQQLLRMFDDGKVCQTIIAVSNFIGKLLL